MVTKLTIILFAFFSIAGRHSSENDTGAACKHYYSQALKKNVYTTTDIEPGFPGGQVACLRFFNRHMRIPQDMIDNDEVLNLASMSKIKFIVDTDGRIINPVVHDKTDTIQLNSFEKEMLRLIKLMPKWEPGICGGKKVAVEINRQMFTCIRPEAVE